MNAVNNQTGLSEVEDKRTRLGFGWLFFVRISDEIYIIKGVLCLPFKYV